MPATSFKNIANTAKRSTVTSGQLNNTTDPVTFSVADATGWPTANFWVTVWDRNTYIDPNDDPGMEILLVPSRTGNSLAACVRAALGTSNAAHTGTPAIRPLIEGQHFTDLATAVNALETGAAASTPHQEAPAGAVNGSNVTFTLTYTPIANSFLLWVNGILQIPSSDAVLGAGEDFYLSGTTITMAVAPTTGDLLWSYGWAT